MPKESLYLLAVAGATFIQLAGAAVSPTLGCTYHAVVVCITVIPGVVTTQAVWLSPAPMAASR